MFLKKLSIQSDRRQVLSELETVLQAREWGESNQIGLRHRPDATDRWGDAIGSLYNRRDNIKLDAETSFTEWTIEGDWYTRQQIELLQSTLGVQIGRVRFMRLLPKCGLSVHRDDEVRYHLVLKTNPKAYMARASMFDVPLKSDLPCVAMCFHMPADGYWYQVDTRETHWVYNGGDEERIHLVVCGV